MTEKRRLIVETDLEREPIAGRVESGSCPSRPFTGWLELMAALEAALTAAAQEECERKEE